MRKNHKEKLSDNINENTLSFTANKATLLFTRATNDKQTVNTQL